MPLPKTGSVLNDPFVRKSLYVWGGFAIFFAFLATVLTYVVVAVAQDRESGVQVVSPYYAREDINGTGTIAPLGALFGPAPARDMPPRPLPTTPFGQVDRGRLHFLSSSIIEYHEHGRDTFLILNFVRGIHESYLVNNLTGPAACNDTAAMDSPEHVAVTAERVPDSVTDVRDLWRVTLTPAKRFDPIQPDPDGSGREYRWTRQASFGGIKCNIRPQIDWETFTTQRVVFMFFSPRAKVRQDLGLDAFAPADGLNVDLSDVEGAENVTYIGGYSSDKSFSNVESPERIRTVHTGNKFQAHWQVINRAEGRDAILVIVGSLIALAAAMAVEAIRPMFEYFLKPDAPVPE